MKERSDLKIGTKVIIKTNGKVKRVTISNIIIEPYGFDYKVVVKYVDELNIEYTDFINTFLDNLVYDPKNRRLKEQVEMTREEKEQTGKYVLQMARLLENGCYQQEMLLKAVHIIDEALEQEPTTKNDSPKYCDRSICLRNEYNNVGCEDCEVTKSQEPTTKNDLGVKLISKSDVDKIIDCPYFRQGDKLIQIMNLPSITAISKTDYETRLKADLITMMKELKTEIEELLPMYYEMYYDSRDIDDLIQQKINAIEEQEK